MWLLLLGNFETLGSKFRHETKGLLPSYTAIKEVNLVSDSHKTPFKIEKTSHSSKRKSSHIWLLLLGNFETLGSKFRHETKGLLPSFATI